MARSRQDADNRPGNSIPPSIYVCVYVYGHVRACMCVYVCVYIYIYIYIHIRVYVGACAREPGRLRVTVYSGTNYYTGVPLVNACPCKSAPGKKVSLEEEIVLPSIQPPFSLSLSLSLSFCFALHYNIPGEVGLYAEEGEFKACSCFVGRWKRKVESVRGIPAR